MVLRHLEHPAGPGYELGVYVQSHVTGRPTTWSLDSGVHCGEVCSVLSGSPNAVLLYPAWALFGVSCSCVVDRLHHLTPSIPDNVAGGDTRKSSEDIFWRSKEGQTQGKYPHSRRN